MPVYPLSVADSVGPRDPRKTRHKRLIVCFDGTWNTAGNGGNPTNVVRLARAIKAEDAAGVVQTVLYDSGVGTGNWVDRLLGGAIGSGIEDKIKAAYLFLAQNYLGPQGNLPADEIYVFGFSRGAFAARSLCGFVGACKGLLRRDQLHKLDQAWRYYRTPPARRNKFMHYEEIESAVRPDVRIRCVGVWDTVGALGIPGNLGQCINRRRYGFHNAELGSLVERAFHAMAIDEKRGPFVASLWQRPRFDIPNQIVEQVWFPGVHSNVGGSYPDTDLSDLTLRWMIARVQANTALQFDEQVTGYLLPETLHDHAEKKDGIAHIASRWQGKIYDPAKSFSWSRLRPMIRLIAMTRPAIRWWQRRVRYFPGIAAEPFGEAVHWSATQRFASWRAEDIERYEPVNLSAVSFLLESKRLGVVAITDECKRGKPWVPQRARPSGKRGLRRRGAKIAAIPGRQAAQG